MALSISDYLKIAPFKFSSTGAFDAVLDVDSLLFLDPLLLRKTRVPEFKASYAKVETRFKAIGKLLKHSNGTPIDPFWRQAERDFQFPEVQGLCIGYSSKGTGGAGMGRGLRTAVLSTGKAIIDAGNEDPEIFELMGLFQENVGPDRIRDMVARIIIEDIFSPSTTFTLLSPRSISPTCARCNPDRSAKTSWDSFRFRRSGRFEVVVLFGMLSLAAQFVYWSRAVSAMTRPG